MNNVQAKINAWEREFHARYPENQEGQANHARMMARDLSGIYDALHDVKRKLFEVANEHEGFPSTNSKQAGGRSRSRSRKTRSLSTKH